LSAGTAYYLVSQETDGGDTWYNNNTTVQTTAVATESSDVWGYGAGQWYPGGAPGTTFVPVDFQYTTTGAPVASTGATVRYVTGQTLGALRNDYSGYVGMQIIVGSSPINVTALGRIMASGNKATHTVKLVRASDGTDVPGGSVSLAMSGGTVNQFQYATLTNSLMLSAGTAYYLVSQETDGGDAWYNNTTTVQTTAVATESSQVWGYGAGQWYPGGAPGTTFVPVDFQYTTSTASSGVTVRYVTGQTLGASRNDYSGYVGMQIVVDASPINVTALGRIMASGNKATHTVKLVRASDGTDVPGGSVSLAMSGGTVNQFQYATLTNSVVLSAGTAYYLVSQETDGGDAWYNNTTTVQTTAVATESSQVWGYGSGQWYPGGAPGTTFVPVDFQYSQ
jgi:hypothetical protein